MRLPGYDYSQPGYYFITICTKDRRNVFGSVRDEQIRVNVFGEVVQQCWSDLPNHYYCILDVFVVMPNHVHGIIIIPEALLQSNIADWGLNPSLRQGEKTFRNHPLTEIVRGFKTFSAAAVNRINGTRGARLWQTSFHEHILRSEYDVNTVREYIRLNPMKWNLDSKNTERME